MKEIGWLKANTGLSCGACGAKLRYYQERMKRDLEAAQRTVEKFQQRPSGREIAASGASEVRPGGTLNVFRHVSGDTRRSASTNGCDVRMNASGHARTAAISTFQCKR